MLQDVIFATCIIVIHNFVVRGNVWLPMSLLHWEALCTSCQSGSSMRFGESIYTGHALLMHELLNFIVPSSSPCNLAFSVSLLIHLPLSLSVCLSLSFNHLHACSLVLYCSHSSKLSAPVFQIHLCMDFNDLSGMDVLSVCVTYHT